MTAGTGAERSAYPMDSSIVPAGAPAMTAGTRPERGARSTARAWRLSRSRR